MIFDQKFKRKSLRRILFWTNFRAAIWRPFRAIGRVFRPVHACCGARRDGGHKFGCSVGGKHQMRFSADFKWRKDSER